MSPLHIYKASAGSGKTFALTMEYLKLLYMQPAIHRHILAVTFTNKAAAEMKQRILGRLSALSHYPKGENLEEMKQLVQFTGLDEESVSRRAGELLDTILNDYSWFSVGTIDKFFQSVIRAFTREVGIQPGYNLELDHPRVLSLAVDRMFQDLGNHPELQEWLIRYAEERMEESKSWNFRQEIIQLGMQLFKESFQGLFLKHDISLLNKQNLDLFLQDMGALERETRNGMMATGKDALQRMEALNLTPEDFQLKSRSPAMLFVTAGEGKDVNFTDSKLLALELPEKWLNNGATGTMTGLTKDHLIPLLNEVYRLQVILNTLAAVRAHFYTLGILADIWEYIRDYTRERNLFLIADSARFLRGIIGGNQVPFVYERTGNRYHHIMLDEFQDTSLFQYDNFRPLLDNSLASGHQNLVVGDIKQSIYRWRNSDWRILSSELERDFSHQKIKIDSLYKNFRSREQIVRFNNTVFQLASQLLSQQMGHELLVSPVTRDEAELEVNQFRNAYEDVVQQIPDHLMGTGGYVKGVLFRDEEQDFQDQVLEQLPGWVEEIRQSGIEPGQTAILVRTRKEGVAVANRLLEHARKTGETKQFKLISNESLLLVHNNSVSLLVSLLRFLVQPGNELNNTLLKYQYYLVDANPDKDMAQLFGVEVLPEHILPKVFMEQQELLKQLPLYELIESLIDLFSLGTRMEDLPYLQAFQDVVIDLQRRDPLGIRDFLDYWDQYGSKRGISVSEESNALRILTIHKSKGLEFKAVLVPFCDWEVTTDQRNSDILWCETEATPMDRIPTVPVKFSSRMIHTLFAPAYYREKMKGYMDKLNLMYVAFTRARDVLYIGIPGKEVKGLKTTGDLLQTIMERVPAKEPCTSVLKSYLDRDVFSIGTMPVYEAQPVEEDPWQFKSYPVSRENRTLKVRLRNDPYFVDEGGVFRTGRMYGNLMHRIFSRITSETDLEPVLMAMQREGLVPGKERKELSAMIRKKLNDATVIQWFPERGTTLVFNERSILCGDGNLIRPDRVILDGERITVVDFKFGEQEKPSYRNQVRNYMAQLGKMDYREVEGFVWYVMLDKIVKV
jgi:ATP-dependent helicase/nuclease subunit A